MTSAQPSLHSSTSVENSSVFPRSLNPTTYSFVFPSISRARVGITLIRSLSDRNGAFSTFSFINLVSTCFFAKMAKCLSRILHLCVGKRRQKYSSVGRRYNAEASEIQTKKWTCRGYLASELSIMTWMTNSNRIDEQLSAQNVPHCLKWCVS